MARANRLYQAIREVLFREWDPIGVNDNPLCEDEYDSYARRSAVCWRQGPTRSSWPPTPPSHAPGTIKPNGSHPTTSARDSLACSSTDLAKTKPWTPQTPWTSKHLAP